jgi:biopolymer transport protein TolR
MIDRSLNLFSVAFLGVVLSVFVVMFAGTPMVCGLGEPYAELPWARSATVLADSDHDLYIHVTKEQRIFVGRNAVPRRDLRHELVRVAACTSTDRHVLVRADGSLPFALVQDVLTASRDAGYTEVSLVTFRGTRLEAWEKGGAV